MTYDEWLESVPFQIKDDAIWNMQVYRQALFLSDLAWFDTCKLIKDRRTLEIADQLYRASGRISAHISEEYSKESGKDRARFYEYGLGSSREARDWYHKGRHVLGEEVASHWMNLTFHLIRQLLHLVPLHRSQKLAEARAIYEFHTIDDLLTNIPMP